MAAYLSTLTTITLFSLMFSLGLNITFSEITSLWRDKKLLAKSLIAVDILVPLVGLLLVSLIDLDNKVKAGILLMLACPGAPMIARKAVKAGSSLSFSLSLQSTVVLLSVITTPITIALFSSIYDATASVKPLIVAQLVFTGQLIPIAIGILLNEKKPNIVNKIRDPMTKLSNLLLLLLVIFILIIGLKALAETTVISFVVMVIMAIASLAIGHFMGGTKLETRQSLAIACATRNGGLALFVGTLNFPDPEIKTYLVSAIVTYALIAAIITIPYLKLIKSNQQEVPQD